mmetsp:Transcript_54617/g.119137  ORF Transcript_54617/g.119137 Transcript_54617/m.119137 type:complete len:232 (-) Transcript_54617:1589-2284(-)
MMYLRRSAWSMYLPASRRSSCCCTSSSATASGCERLCERTTNSARRSSAIGSISSLTTQTQSKRERMGSDRSTLSWKETEESYRPLTGLAAAMTAQRAGSCALMPALAMEMVCCSMASWIDVRSLSFILSNSSMRQTPLSASTSAPPSRTHSRVAESRCTAAVRPTADAPCPVVYTARGDTFCTYLRNCDLAVPGSPRRSTLMSPRMRCLPLMSLACPPKSESAIDVLMSR